jgi:hypothetical protein
VSLLVVVIIVGALEVDVDVVDELHDARTSEITMRHDSTIQIVPLFI